jgi:hypothetical protein
MIQYMCALIIVCYLGSNIPNLMIPICGLSRWKDPERKKISQKVLWHFPLAPRLKRMFTTKEASESGQWHNVKPQPCEKEMSHLADGEAWQDFDTEFLDLQKMQENLGLALPLTASIHFRKRTQSTSCCLCLWCHISFHHGNAWKSKTSRWLCLS